SGREGGAIAGDSHPRFYGEGARRRFPRRSHAKIAGRGSISRSNCAILTFLMRNSSTSATTRAVVRTRGFGGDGRSPVMKSGQSIVSPQTHLEYRIDRLLGEGGFGQVYLARRVGRSAVVPDIVCVKASTRIDGWLREAYFGQLLDGHPRAIRVYDAFPL